MALEASKEYFSKVTGIVDRVRNYSASNTGDRAQWNARLANRIDELPTLNVDSDLVDFGVRVSKGLRGNVVAMQQANIQAQAQANSQVAESAAMSEVQKQQALSPTQIQVAQAKNQFEIEKMEYEARLKQQLMELEFQYNICLSTL